MVKEKALNLPDIAHPRSVFVLLPAYNEVSSLKRLIPELLATLRNIGERPILCIVDDASTDGTPSLLKSFAADKAVHGLKHAINRGYGAALLTGYQWILQRGRPGDVVISMDADRTHPVEYVPRLLAKIDEGAPVVTASYHKPGGRAFGIPWTRLVMSRVLNTLLGWRVHLPGAKTFTNGFRAYRWTALKETQAAYGDHFIEETGFPGGTELFIKTTALVGGCAEVPFELHYELRGSDSKIRIATTVRRYASLLLRAGEWSKTPLIPVAYYVLGAILAHGFLALDAARRASPAWDEIVYPAAGTDLWRTGKARISKDHPPLGKVIMALPVLPWASRLKPPPPVIELDAYRFGFQFLHGNNVSPRLLTFLPRVAMVVASVALALLVYAGASSAWGPAGGLAALFLYGFSPPVLARASLGLLEMPLALFMTSALWCYIRRRDSGLKRFFWGWALFLTAAFWTKATAWILAPTFLLCDAALPLKRKERLPRIAETSLVIIAALGACELLSRLVGGSYVAAQLWQRKSDLAASRFPFYFCGAQWDRAGWYFAATAWLIKTPLAVTALAAGGFAVWVRRHPGNTMLWAISCFLMMAGLVMVSVRSLVATSHYFYLYPCLAWLGSAAFFVRKPLLKWVVRAVWATVLIGAWVVHPNHLAYFNGLIGGSSHGYRWLADSDQDWGQGLSELGSWLKKENLSQILLGYSGGGDPRVYGITYQDVISPALITASYRGEVFRAWPGRIVMALGTKVAQTEPDLLGWLLKNRQPTTLVGYTFLIYDLTGDRQALEWLRWFYRVTRRANCAAAFPN